MKIIRIGSVLAALAVMAGAFGAHALKGSLDAGQLHTFETGVRYHFYHALALLLCGILDGRGGSKALNLAAGSFLGGILCFSGSLYLLATGGLIGMESTSWLGPVTPLGGLLFIIGWFMLFRHAQTGSNSTTSNPS